MPSEMTLDQYEKRGTGASNRLLAKSRVGSGNRNPRHAHTHTQTVLKHREKSQVFKFFKKNHNNTNNLIKVKQKNS